MYWCIAWLVIAILILNWVMYSVKMLIPYMSIVQMEQEKATAVENQMIELDTQLRELVSYQYLRDATSRQRLPLHAMGSNVVLASTCDDYAVVVSSCKTCTFGAVSLHEDHPPVVGMACRHNFFL